MTASFLISFQDKTLAGAFDADDGDLLETFFEDGGLQLFGHFAQDVFTDAAIAFAVALEADFKWHIKEDGLDLVSKALSHLDPLAALVNGEVGGVNVVQGHAGDEAGAEEGAEGGEDQALVALFLDVVKEDVAQEVAGERSDTAAAEPGGFAGAGKADCEDDEALGGLRRAACGFGFRRWNAWGLGLGFKLKAAGIGGLVPFHPCRGFMARRARMGLNLLHWGGLGWGGSGCGGLVVVERDQGSELVGRNFLADFTCGF